MLHSPQRIVVVGAGGRLGQALAREFGRSNRVSGFNHAQLDLADDSAMRERLGELEFDLLINCAAQTNVDRCETHSEEAFRLNAEAPGVLAQICAAKNARLVHVSTDYVFDGANSEPYREEDAANPISVYGASKLAGEERVLAVDEKNLVVRVSWVFGPDRSSFVDWVIGQAREKEHVAAVSDKFSAPTYTLDIAKMIDCLFDGAASGVIHLANEGECSWREYGQWALDCCAAEGIPLRAQTVDAITLADMTNFVARRPRYTVLSTQKFARLTSQRPRHWRDAVAEYVRAYVRPRVTV